MKTKLILTKNQKSIIDAINFCYDELGFDDVTVEDIFCFSDIYLEEDDIRREITSCSVIETDASEYFILLYPDSISMEYGYDVEIIDDEPKCYETSPQFGGME